MIRLHGLRETIAFKAINAYDVPNDTRVMQTLQEQIKQLFRIVHTMNEYFWPALLELDGLMAEVILAGPQLLDPEFPPEREDYESRDEDQGLIPLPGRHSFLHPQQSSRGTVEEMQLALGYSYEAWLETPGAIDVIRVLSQRNGVGMTKGLRQKAMN